MATIYVMGQSYNRITTVMVDGTHTPSSVPDTKIAEFEDVGNGAVLMLDEKGSPLFRYSKQTLEDYGWVELDKFER